MKIYAHMAYGLDGVRYRELFDQGIAPDSSPYGLHNASLYGWPVTFSRDASHKFALCGGHGKLLHLCHALYNRKAISAADAVWTMTEREAFAVAALFRLGIARRKPIIGNAVWLFERWDEYSMPTRILYTKLSEYVSELTVHSRECIAPLRKNLPLVKGDLSLFGVNDEIFSPRRSARPKPRHGSLAIFAAGNDVTRDWSTLLNAFGNDPRFQVFIACQWLENSVEMQYSNVKLVRDPKIADFIEHYENADWVVVPMKSNIYSGITSALEAAGMARPIISTQTGGVPTYFDSSEVCYVQPGDVSGMREAALNYTSDSRSELGNRARKRFVESQYTTKAMARRYIHLTQLAIDRQDAELH